MEQFSATTRRRLNRLAAVVFASAGLLGLLVLCRSLDWPLVDDAPLLHYPAWQISQGATPYRDVFDMNFPGTYLIHLAIISVPGDMDVVWRVFDLCLLGTALTLMVIAFPAPYRRYSAAVACVTFLLRYLAYGPQMCGQRDMMMATMQLAAVLALARLLERERPSVWWALFAGVLFGAATTIKPFGLIPFAAAMLFVAIWARTLGRSASNIVATVAIASLGFALPIAGVLLWLHALGGLEAFLDIFLNYTIPIYSKVDTSASVSKLFFSLLGSPFSMLFLFFIGIMAIYSVLARRVTARYGLLLVATLCGLAHFVCQRKGWPYHALPMLTFGTLTCFWHLHEAMSYRDVYRWTVGVGTPVVIVVLAMVKCGMNSSYEQYSLDKHRQVESLGEYLSTQLPDGEQVQVFDTMRGGIDALLRARIEQPTRFLYDFMFLAGEDRGPYVRAMREEFLSDLVSRPPRFLVIYRRGWPDGEYERIERFGELSDWIDRNYTLHAEEDEYRILEKADRS